MIKSIKNTIAYLRLTLAGNEIKRLTDFTTCHHPVLLLCGFGASRKVFSTLEKRLRRDRFCVFSLNLGGMFDTFNTRCIEELAKLVRSKVERLCRRFRLKKISIIGHSKGGLIGHYYVKKLGGATRVRNLITLGTPHYGNPWALLGLVTPLSVVSKSIWQMVPMSPFLRRLNRGRFPNRVRLVSLYSKNDRICFYKSAMLDIPKGCRNMKNVELPSMGHADYLMRLEAYRVIRRELLNSSSERQSSAGNRQNEILRETG